MSHTKRSLLVLNILLTSLYLSVAGANGATFSLINQGTGVSGFAVISDVGGITATFSNPGFGGAGSSFYSDSDGLVVFADPTSGPIASITSFDLSFDQDVQLISFTVGYASGVSAPGTNLSGNETFTFDATGGNISIESTSTNLPLKLIPPGDAPLTANFNTQITVTAGTTISVSATGVDSGELLQFSEIVVNPVPEPSTALLLFSASLMAVFRRRK